MRWEETEWVTAIHDKCLLVGHLAQVFHDQPVLGPVLEDGTVATIDDQLVGVLRHTRVEVVLNHEHDGGCLTAACGILVDGAGIHLVARAVAVHIDAPIVLQLLSKLGSQLGVELFGEVTEGVAQGEPFLLGCEDVFALGRMVDVRVVGLRLGQGCRDAEGDFFSECFVHGFYSCFL